MCDRSMTISVWPFPIVTRFIFRPPTWFHLIVSCFQHSGSFSWFRNHIAGPIYHFCWKNGASWWVEYALDRNTTCSFEKEALALFIFISTSIPASSDGEVCRLLYWFTYSIGCRLSWNCNWLRFPPYICMAVIFVTFIASPASL